VAITLPYRFDTSSVWRTILKGAFGFNALLIVCILYVVLISRQWATALGLALMALFAFVLTRVFVGTLSSDRVVIEPNVLVGITLPGPKGTYALDRFRAVRVEFRSGPIGPSVQGGRATELVWLVGKPGPPTSCWR
jgi:fucose 4-O-acetylase-like acetyltransferase